MAGTRRTVLAVLCAASFLAVVDTTIVSIALPSIRHARGMSPAGAQWVLTAYSLVFGGLLLLFGRLADRYGRRRAFLAGLVVFAAGSAVAGLAPSPAVLVAGRVLQGLGAAAFVPSSLSLLTTAYQDGAERGRALGAYGAMAGLGFVAGMVGGGVLTELWGWRWIFLVNLPLVLVTLVPAARVLAESRTGSRRPLDAGGAGTVTVGLVLVVVALAAAPEHGRADHRRHRQPRRPAQRAGGRPAQHRDPARRRHRPRRRRHGGRRRLPGTGFLTCLTFTTLAMALTLTGLRPTDRAAPGRLGT
jgi:MFS family permease